VPGISQKNYVKLCKECMYLYNEIQTKGIQSDILN